LSEPKAFVNGKIILSYKPLRIVGGMFIAEGKVVYAGDPHKSASAARSLGGEVIDLSGKTIIPGFIDSHIHLDGLGAALKSLDLRGTRSIAELRRRLRQYISTYNPGIVYGRGWDQELFSDSRWPRKEDIDDITGDIPALLVRVCGHAALLNSAALDIILADLPESMNRFVQKKNSGPTGIIFEDLVTNSYEKIVGSKLCGEFILEASRELALKGVTSVGFMSVTPDCLRDLLEIERQGLLRTRVHVYMDIKYIDYLISAGIKGGYGSDLVKINGIKLFVDGSLGARTAYLSREYSDEKGCRGELLITPENLAQTISTAFENNLQVAAHAIGDGAIDVVLKAYSSIDGRTERNLRIEHASVIRPDQIEKISSLGIQVSIQPGFVLSDWWALSRLGTDRSSWIYPFRRMLENGIVMGFSSDAPVESPDPRYTLHAAETRRGDNNKEVWKSTWGERIDRIDALDLYTRGSARLLLNNRIGSLSKGSYADFIIVDNDPLELYDIRKMVFREVYLGGFRVA
jgi:predicted amidohydrolase YtcJ